MKARSLAIAAILILAAGILLVFKSWPMAVNTIVRGILFLAELLACVSVALAYFVGKRLSATLCAVIAALIFIATAAALFYPWQPRSQVNRIMDDLQKVEKAKSNE